MDSTLTNKNNSRRAAHGVCLLLLIAGCSSAPPSPSAPTTEDWKLSYPASPKGEVTDDYHGQQIADPYRWLEDPDSPETIRWVEAQNKVTSGYLERIPYRGKLRERLTKLWNYERFGLPARRGDRYFFSHNNGLQNQSVLYTADGLAGEPRVLLDPNELSQDGTVSLSGWSVSNNGELLAYGLSSAGSDWVEWRVIEVETGRRLLDHLQWVKFSGIAWTPDDKGIYYCRYDEPKKGEEFTGSNYYQKLYYHPLGEPQFKDTLVYRRDDEKEWGFDPEVTEDGRYLIISVWRGTERKNQIFYQDLQQPGSPVVELISGFDAEYGFLGNEGSKLLLVTDLDAPLRRVIEVDLEKPERENWRELIPEGEHVAQSVSLVGDTIFVRYLKHAHAEVERFDLAGKSLGSVELPGLGSVGGFGGRRSQQETFYAFTNFTTPGNIYRYDLATGKSEIHRSPQVDFASDQYETRQVFYQSKDGAKVPMFLTHKKGMKFDGSQPTLLYGYGGFNISITPSFSVSNAVWLEAGGVYAVANLRGGGEYGRPWHEAGMLEKKQNVFDDFTAAAQWLIENNITSSEKLAIRGQSNGGLLVGAMITQHPDLFAAAVPGVGVMDMLRFHKFTIGWAWVNEYGSSDDAPQFKHLLAYSPLHNIKAGTKYPATLVTTGDHDDRVVPAHSHKFTATLQAAQATGGPPILTRIEVRTGHGAGKPVSKQIEESADVLAFLMQQLGMDM